MAMLVFMVVVMVMATTMTSTIIMTMTKVGVMQPSQNQAVVGSLSRLLEMFDRLLSKCPITFSFIQGSLSLLL